MTTIKTLHRLVASAGPTPSAYAVKRRRAALRIGSRWIFFRDGDKQFKDPWSALEIRIVEASVNATTGRLFLRAECVKPKHIRLGARRVPAIRRVRYSELW